MSFKNTSFKYISCSYLSVHNNELMLELRLFKYISCSYLSLMLYGISSGYINLNTSHVLIYLFRQMTICPSKFNLNTSHVLIYRFRTNGGKVGWKRFKYISCSYLSWHGYKRLAYFLI